MVQSVPVPAFTAKAAERCTSTMLCSTSPVPSKQAQILCLTPRANHCFSRQYKWISSSNTHTVAKSQAASSSFVLLCSSSPAVSSTGSGSRLPQKGYCWPANLRCHGCSCSTAKDEPAMQCSNNIARLCPAEQLRCCSLSWASQATAKPCNSNQRWQICSRAVCTVGLSFMTWPNRH